MTDEVLFERRGAVGLITLNRPKALNALTHEMCVAMKAQLDNWACDAAVKTVVIGGTGDRAFCAGGDIRALFDSGKAGTSYALDFYRDEYRLNAAIKHFPKPYMALLHGIVMGGGVGVSAHGSHRVASEGMTFAMPETGIGLFPDVGGSYFLPRLPGEIGMYVALTGERLNVADSVYAGVATHFVPTSQNEVLLAALEQGAEPDYVLQSFAEKPPQAPLSTMREAIDRIFSAGSLEGILSGLDDDGSEWAAKIAAIIRKKSPTSLKITFRQIRDGVRLSFDECMRMEYRMVNRIVAGHDFYEGVRAAIIDKDNSPKWNPADLSGVTAEQVDAYFAPLPEGDLKLN
jgi:enoyl-CoA hydratase